MEGFGNVPVADTPSPKLGRKGQKVNIDGSGTGISGAGIATCAVMMEQDKAYWEIKVTKAGPCWLGVATGAAALENLPDLNEDEGDMGNTKLYGHRSEDDGMKGKIKEGTVVGMSYNQASGPPTINFFIDGELLEGVAIEGIRGVVTPAVGVQQGAELKCNFSHQFEVKPTGRYEKYDGIMLAGSMI